MTKRGTSLPMVLVLLVASAAAASWSARERPPSASRERAGEVLPAEVFERVALARDVQEEGVPGAPLFDAVCGALRDGRVVRRTPGVGRGSGPRAPAPPGSEPAHRDRGAGRTGGGG